MIFDITISRSTGSSKVSWSTTPDGVRDFRNIAYKNFFNYMNTRFEKETFDQVLDNIKDMELFAPVYDFIHCNWVSTNYRYYALNPGPLNRYQQEMLLQLQIGLYFKYQAIGEWISGEAKSDFEGYSSEKKEDLRNLNFRYKYDRSLVDLRDQGILSNLQLQYFLQQGYYFKFLYDDKFAPNRFL